VINLGVTAQRVVSSLLSLALVRTALNARQWPGWLTNSPFVGGLAQQHWHHITISTVSWVTGEIPALSCFASILDIRCPTNYSRILCSYGQFDYVLLSTRCLGYVLTSSCHVILERFRNQDTGCIILLFLKKYIVYLGFDTSVKNSMIPNSRMLGWITSSLSVLQTLHLDYMLILVNSADGDSNEYSWKLKSHLWGMPLGKNMGTGAWSTVTIELSFPPSNLKFETTAGLLGASVKNYIAVYVQLVVFLY
jgi:hypothetical protein